MNDVLLSRAFEWLDTTQSEAFLSNEEYCATRDIFQTRLEHMQHYFEQTRAWDNTSLIIAILGEIGNNAYDHNLGMWRDVPGVYFAYDTQPHTAVIADRGQGIRATLIRICPTLANDKDALHIAFTEVISGRAPEQRGNGLKFVKRVVQEKDWRLCMYSGHAMAEIAGNEFSIRAANQEVRGCVAALEWK